MFAGLADGFLSFVLVVTVVCLTIRYLLPVALTALVAPLCGVVGILAALLVLPEYWVSTACRRDGGTPPHVAYLYGDGVCRLARLGHQGVRHLLRALARAAHGVPPVAVVLVMVVWQLDRVLP
jgi:hypothetical protein